MGDTQASAHPTYSQGNFGTLVSSSSFCPAQPLLMVVLGLNLGLWSPQAGELL